MARLLGMYYSAEHAGEVAKFDDGVQVLIELPRHATQEDKLNWRCCMFQSDRAVLAHTMHIRQQQAVVEKCSETKQKVKQVTTKRYGRRDRRNSLFHPLKVSNVYLQRRAPGTP